MVVASGNPPLVSPVGLMRVQGLDPVPMSVDKVSTSPVVSVGGRSMANRLDPVPMLVDTVSTSPVVSAGGRSMMNRLDVVPQRLVWCRHRRSHARSSRGTGSNHPDAVKKGFVVLPGNADVSGP